MPHLKVLFITDKLKHYRVPILNIISNCEEIDLTVLHSGEEGVAEKKEFDEIIIQQRKLVVGFRKHEGNLREISNNYDVVVCMLYLRQLSMLNLIFSNPRNFKLLYWTIGVRASQKHKFDSFTVFNYLRLWIAKKSDGMIFYTDYAREKYIRKGISPEKLFVMPNTVKVEHQVSGSLSKDKILFIGTLNPSKKIMELVTNYFEAYLESDNILPLHIIGGGMDFELVEQFILTKKLEKKIILHGPVFDQKIIESLFKTSIVCISPNQAGLSVLTSFAFGVPFITHRNAITGGERLNIIDDYNGVLLNNFSELKTIILDLNNNLRKYVQLGINAKDYYDKKRTPEIMAQGFINAVNRV